MSSGSLWELEIVAQVPERRELHRKTAQSLVNTKMYNNTKTWTETLLYICLYK